MHIGPWSTGCCPCERSLNTPPPRQSPPNKATLDTQDHTVSKNGVFFWTLSGWLRHVVSWAPTTLCNCFPVTQAPSPAVQVSRPCLPRPPPPPAWRRLHPVMGLDDQGDRGACWAGSAGRKQTGSLSEWGQRCGTWVISLTAHSAFNLKSSLRTSDGPSLLFRGSPLSQAQCFGAEGKS